MIGSVFGKLKDFSFIKEHIMGIFSTNDTVKQIQILQQMFVRLGENHNRIGLSKVVDPKVASYEVGVNNAVRSYKIFNSSDYKDACIESIKDQALQELIFVGTVDQITNVSDAMINFTDWDNYFSGRV